MHKDNHHSPLAVTYAEALLELATEGGNQAEPVGQELRDLRQILDTDKRVGIVLTDPGISQHERAALLKRVFDGRVSPLLMKFLDLLNIKGRLGLLPAIAGAYDDLLDTRLGKVEVDVTVAHRLDESTLENVRQKVSAALKRDAVVHQYVDERIIGGLILRVQDQLIDGSVRAQLAMMRERVMAAAPK